jgi:hypothetical protein
MPLSNPYHKRVLGGLHMKLRTVCAMATIFMAFFTIAVWKSPVSDGN